MFLTVKDIYLQSFDLVGKKIEIAGWVRSIRKQGKKMFIVLNDGSSLNNIQLIISRENLELKKIEDIGFGSAIISTGELVLTPSRDQPFELCNVNITFLQKVIGIYPLQKQKIPLIVLRENVHLRSKTQFFLAVFMVRHAIVQAAYGFFNKEGFYNICSPIITNNDAEGAGEQFIVKTTDKRDDFFSGSSNLSVSGQLHLEALTQGLSKVYSINPCFRAEKSHTNRHLSEFWMIESEFVCNSLYDIINLAKRLIKHILNTIIKDNKSELDYFGEHIINKIKKILSDEWRVIEYTEAVSILQKYYTGAEDNRIVWGSDLSTEQEKFICNFFSDSPVFVINYPVLIKAFYMKVNLNDSQTVLNFDLLVPKIGELVGGSLRKIDFNSIKSSGFNESLGWYADLRNSGYLPTGGFGLGLERLLMFILEIDNIRDVIPFFVTYNNLKY